MGEYWLPVARRGLAPSRPPNPPKRELARRLTDRFWGDGAGAGAEERFDQIHKRGELPEDIPVSSLAGLGFDGGEVHVPALLTALFGLSSSEGRRLITQGAVRIDGAAIGSDVLDLPSGEVAGKVLQVGKRRFARIDA